MQNVYQVTLVFKWISTGGFIRGQGSWHISALMMVSSWDPWLESGFYGAVLSVFVLTEEGGIGWAWNLPSWVAVMYAFWVAAWLSTPTCSDP